VAIRRTFHCDGPDCERWCSQAAHRKPGGRFLTVTREWPALHFCGWDCVLRYAATMEPEVVVPFGPQPDPE
jgi:hypothetical protein